MLGAAVGLPVLGIGGRVAMRVVATGAGPAPAFTPEGTTTVLLAGAGSGAVAGIIHLVLARMLPRHPRLHAMTFALALGALTLRGLRPLDAQRIVLFAPLMAMFAALYLVAWRALERASRNHSSQGAPECTTSR